MKDGGRVERNKTAQFMVRVKQKQSRGTPQRGRARDHGQYPRSHIHGPPRHTQECVLLTGYYSGENKP